MNNSLYDYICSSIVDGKLPRDFSLPKLDTDLVYADGAKDGIYIYHMNPTEMSSDDYELMCDAIDMIDSHDFDLVDKLFIELAKDNPAITIIDKFQNYIIENREEIDADIAHEYAINLVTKSDNRECVKYGLLILELLNTNDDNTKNIIRTLALSDEFTYFCIFKMKSWPNGNQEIFELAKKLYGWGKIHAVSQLRALDPLYDEIRKWILEEGIDNDVMPSYSALACWKNGNVGSTLYTKPTYEQFRYIGRIIDALLDESAVNGLSTLDKRKEIILTYLNEAEKMPLVIEDYEVIYDIYKYFEEIEDSQEVLSLADKLLNTYKARNAVLDAVKDGKAIELAIKIGINVKPYVLSYIKRSFKDGYHLCRYLTNDERYRKEVIYIFKNNLPLKQMISVPKNSLGFDDNFVYHNALEFLLQDLRNYPCEAKEFVEVGLQCEPVRTRNSALNVLQNWVSQLEKPLSEILPDIHSLLIMLSGIEVNDDLKKRMDELISGKISFEDNKFSIKDNVFSMEALNILSDAISDIGSWTWWYTDENSAQVEFNGVQLYDYSKKEKESHSSLIALRFTDNAFLMVLDNLETDEEKKWYEKLHDDEIQPYDIETYEFTFNDAKYVNEMFELYKNKNTLKQFKDDEEVFLVKYILACKCYNVGFVIGGNNLEVVSHNGTFNEEEIKEANIKWWEYWKDYWRLRKSKDAYEKDYACELTIPIKDKE